MIFSFLCKELSNSLTVLDAQGQMQGAVCWHAVPACVPAETCYVTLRYFAFLQEYLGVQKSNLPDLFGVKVGM